MAVKHTIVPKTILPNDKDEVDGHGLPCGALFMLISSSLGSFSTKSRSHRCPFVTATGDECAGVRGRVKAEPFLCACMSVLGGRGRAQK